MIYVSLLQRQTQAMKNSLSLSLMWKTCVILGHIQAKVSNCSKEKKANYFFGIKNAESFYLTCALLSGWCYDLTSCYAKMQGISSTKIFHILLLPKR